MRLVIDSSVLAAAVQPGESEHVDARAFVDRLRRAIADKMASAFGPPELWLEVHVVERRLALTRRGRATTGGALDGLAITLVAADDLATLTEFLALLDRRMRGRRPFANATDLAYLWAAWRVDATVVTLDRGLLGYHAVVCDVTRPQHVPFGRNARA